MYIMKRLSRGRGEYEIAETFGDIPASALTGKRLSLQFGAYGYIPTGVIVSDQGGKLRLRILQRPGIHLQRQVQAALLFPKAIRDEDRLPGGLPTIMLNRYIVRRMVFSSLKIIADEAHIGFDHLELSNGTQDADEVNFNKRFLRIEHLHTRASELPTAITQLLAEHRQLFTNSLPIPIRGEQIVELLMREVESIAPDYNLEYVYGTDVLVPVEEILGIQKEPRPIPISAIAPDEIEVRRREAARWRKWAAARGPESAVFRKRVREAYRSKCIICGLRLPQSEMCRIPGVDSAHILPWADYELDIVANGLCLCKTHHWAFDQQLLAITFEEEQYKITLTPRAELAFQNEVETLAELKKCEGTIPFDRLPQSRLDWPRVQFLTQLYDGVPPQ